MNSNTIIISLIYYVGIISCAAQGAEKAKYKNSTPMLHSITNSFGGGFIRDVIILKKYPWLLTISALPDLALAIIIGHLYTYYFFIRKVDKKWYDITIQLVRITDALGLGSFIYYGMDWAFKYSDNVFTIIACGYITAIGGGILSSGKPLMKIFNNIETIRYHLITLLGCCYYYVFKHALSLVCFIAIGLFLANMDYRALYKLHPCHLTTPYLDVFLLYPAVCSKNDNFPKQHKADATRILSIYHECPKIYLVQHRLRQC